MRLLVRFELFVAKSTAWMSDSVVRVSTLTIIVFIFGILLQACGAFEEATSKSGCVLVAIALFFGYGESVNLGIVGLMSKIEEPYENTPEAVQHVSDLRGEARDIERKIENTSGWQFFMAIIGTLVWGFT